MIYLLHAVTHFLRHNDDYLAALGCYIWVLPLVFLFHWYWMAGIFFLFGSIILTWDITDGDDF